MPKSTYRLPFDEHGSLMHYSMENWERPSNVPQAHEWRDREPFHAKLTLTSWHRGHSAAYFIWADEDGRTYSMFVADLFQLICSGVSIADGIAEADWIGIKRGANFGIKLAAAVERGQGT